MDSEVDILDTLFEACDAEFNSNFDLYTSFHRAIGQPWWARYTLLHEVQKVSRRDGLNASRYLCLTVAKEIARIWFEERAKDEHAAEQEYDHNR